MKLRNKVLGSNIIIVFIVILILGTIMVYTADNYNLHSNQLFLINQSDFAINTINQYLRERGGGIEIIVSDKFYITGNLKRNIGCDVEIIPNFSEYIDPYTSQSLNADNAKAERVIRVLQGETVYFVEPGSPRMMYLSFPVYNNQQLIAVVEFKYSLTNVDKSRQEMTMLFIILFLCSYIFVLIFSTYLSYRMLRPLEKLQKTAKHFARGDFMMQSDVDSDDEIGDVARAFNHMGIEINSIIGNLKDEQAKQKSFLDSVTHEIRTPLTNIIGYADLVERVDDEAQQEKCITIIKSEGDRMLKMVDSLLELSMLRQYELPIDRKDCLINEVIEDAIELVKPRLDRNGFTIETNLAKVEAYADVDKLKQVILNLIDNSIKYSEGDNIKLSLKYIKKNTRIELTFMDNGKGIPDKVLDNIMVPFVRVDKSRSRGMGGAGLGLAVCKEIITRHGGELSFANNKNSSGLVATIILPSSKWLTKDGR